MRRTPDLPEGDDGRTIVSMNVDGMPWYAPESAEASIRREAEKTGAMPERREAPPGAYRAP